MFGIFKKQSEREKLEALHKKLLEEAFALSTRNRVLSDLKIAEAAEVEKKILQLNDKAG
jgi:hypothetical protein